jgi:putative hydrolase of the HAD superfamily
MTGRPVEAVLLDAGGVFVLPNASLLASVVRAAGGRCEPHLLHRAHYAAIAAMDATRTDDWARYAATVARTCGVPEERLADAVEAMLVLFSAPAPLLWNQVVPEAVAALRALAETDVLLAVVSNSDGTAEALLRDFEVCQVGEGAGVPVRLVVDSHHVGHAKPDPGIFAFALDALGVAPDRVVHVGDTACADVDGALAAGVTPLHLDPHGDCPYPEGHHEHVQSLADVVKLVGG